MLIDRGANVNTEGYSDSTALLEAVNCGHLKMVQLLIAKGANVRTAGLWDETALHIASGTFDRLKLLSRIGRSGGDDEAYLTIARILIKNGADINAKTTSVAVEDIWGQVLTTELRSQTPIHYAAIFNNTNLIALLMTNGADINAKALEGNTPLDMAVAFTNTAAAQVLKAMGAHAK